MDEVKIGLLGLGRAGGFHMQSIGLLEGVRLAAVYDLDQAKAEAAAAKHGCLVAKSSEEAIDGSQIDAVIVATPTNAHFEFSKLAIEVGKPLLTEKPLGRNLFEIDTCFELAAAAKIPLMVAFQRRFDPSFSSLIKAVRRGDVGRTHFIRSVSRDNPIPSMEYLRISGGMYHDCMVHDLDMVATLADSEVTHLSAFGTSFIADIGEMDDHDSIVGTLKFANGVTASIDINRQSAYGYDQRIEVFGDGGMLQADNQYQSTVTRANAKGFARSPIDFSFPTRYREAYREELACFVRCVRGEEAVPITHSDVRTNHLLAVGMEVAARENRVVKFEEIEQLTVSH